MCENYHHIAIPSFQTDLDSAPVAILGMAVEPVDRLMSEDRHQNIMIYGTKGL